MSLMKMTEDIAQKMKFFIKDFYNKCDQICRFLQIPADLVTFTKEILNEKLRFLCRENLSFLKCLCNCLRGSV